MIHRDGVELLKHMERKYIQQHTKFKGCTIDGILVD